VLVRGASFYIHHPREAEVKTVDGVVGKDIGYRLLEGETLGR
jgi:hypothetical protein